jgi:hypothetical protein
VRHRISLSLAAAALVPAIALTTAGSAGAVGNVTVPEP